MGSWGIAASSRRAASRAVVVCVLLAGVVGGAGCPAGAPGADAGVVAVGELVTKTDHASLAGQHLAEGEHAGFAQALSGHRKKTYAGDLDEVKREGVLRVLTRNNSFSYFLYKGVEAGFDYEIAKMLARELGVRLEMVVAPTRRELVPWLLEGRGDIILAGMSTEAARGDRVHFTQPYLHTPWVVVVRAKDAPTTTTLEALAGKPLLVRPSSGAMKRLRNLTIPGGLSLAGALETLESEDLLDDVEDGKAFGCVIEGRVAQIELNHRPGLAIAFELKGGNDEAAFAVRKENVALHQAASDFLRKHYRGVEWNILYKRYHENVAKTAAMRDDEVRADREGRLTPWDPTFKEAATPRGLDWRLLAAQAYQESRLDPKAKSHMGAVGLMQFLPSTAKELKFDPHVPEQAIDGGARYVEKLMKRFDEEIPLKDRVRFALASYNCGPGHVDDARALAVEMGLDPNRWFGNVEKAMLNLSKPRYYTKARYGYARGEEPVKYVSEIQTRYDAYVALTDG